MADKYEPHEKPSAVPGLAITGAGIGGLAYLARKRIPGLNILSKIAKAKTPPPPEARITPQVVDKVTEITKIAKTPTSQSLALITQPNLAKKFTEVKGAMDLVATKAKVAPLTQGSNQGRFGSSLYDYIAQHPAYKPLDAKIWIKEFSNFNRLAKFKSGQAGFQKVKMNISKGELEDANILRFDGEKIVGGFLTTARDSGLKVSKLDLLNMVNKSPAVNLKVKRFEYVTPMVEESRVLTRDLTKFVDDAEATIKSYKGTVSPTGKANWPAYEREFANVKNEIDDTMQKISKYYQNKNAPIDAMTSAIKPYESIIKKLEKLSKGLAEDHKIGLDLTKLAEFRGHHTNLLRKLGREKTMNQSPRYGDHETYKVLGDEKYIEDVIYYPKVIPYGRNVKPGSAGGGAHYEQVGGVSFDNQVYHVRYGRRAVAGGPEAGGATGRQKAYVVHEGQSDVQQSALKRMSEGATRTNPFNTEQEYAQANYAMQTLLGRMKTISDKGISMSNADKADYWKLSQQFGELRKNTLNASTLQSKANKYSDNEVPFLPFLERDVWGDHLIKHMAKTAADDGVQWIAINPVERLHALKRADSSGRGVAGKLGDWEFYGSAKGKAGMRGVKAYSDKQSKTVTTNDKQMAVLPERMKKLALQYDSIAQPIKVAKSDPELPFKIIKRFEFGSDSAAKTLQYTKAPSEHEMAFKTLVEAQNYLGGREAAARVGTKKIIQMEANDPRLYYEAFGLKITPQMLQQPFKLYKKEGGLVVNMFKC